jgi:Flp pilus assembly protein TadD
MFVPGRPLRALASLSFAIALRATICASAQTYPMPGHVPHTTNPDDLHAQAVARQVHERFTIALSAQAHGDWQTSAVEFAQIIALNPAEPQGSTARYDVAISYANLNRLDDAASALNAALKLDPGFLAAMANLISVDLRRGNLREARDVADRFVALAPDSARALYSRGIVALNSGDARTAQADFGRLLAANPAYAVAHYDLGIAEVRLGQNGDAEREFTTALQLSPTYARARVALGTILLRTGRRAEARVAFAQAARDAAGDPTLQNLAVAMRDAIPQ